MSKNARKNLDNLVMGEISKPANPTADPTTVVKEKVKRPARNRTPVGINLQDAHEEKLLHELAKKGNTVLELDPNDVNITKLKDRDIRGFKDERFARLKEKIRQKGQLTPVGVRKSETSGYELVFGHRRLHACRELGIKVRALLTSADTDLELIEEMVSENEDREDISPWERGQNIVFWEDTGLATRDKVCEMLNKTSGMISKLRKLAFLDEKTIGAIGDPRDLALTTGLDLIQQIEKSNQEEIEKAYKVLENSDEEDPNRRAKEIISLLKGVKNPVGHHGQRIVNKDGLHLATLTKQGNQLLVRFQPTLSEERIRKLVDRIPDIWKEIEEA